MRARRRSVACSTSNWSADADRFERDPDEGGIDVADEDTGCGARGGAGADHTHTVTDAARTPSSATRLFFMKPQAYHLRPS